MEINYSIKKKLRILGVDIESLKPYLVKHLQKVEEEICTRNDNRSLAMETLRQNDYDVKSIAEATGISRTTFYNYDRLLQRYVELSHENDYKDDLHAQIRNLRETVRMLQEEKALMEQRDCRELQIKAENTRLKQQIADRDKTINNLRKRIVTSIGEGCNSNLDK